MSNDLDEALTNARAITEEADTRGYTRRALECIINHLRSHHAPPPSPSEENGGEGASDGEPIGKLSGSLAMLSIAAMAKVERAGGDLEEQTAAATLAVYRAGQEAGKKHQASADAATTEAIKRALIDVVKLARDGGSNAQVDKVIDRMNRELDGRPEPDELTDGPDPIHEGDR